jgi:hypothetical protein
MRIRLAVNHQRFDFHQPAERASSSLQNQRSPFVAMDKGTIV